MIFFCSKPHMNFPSSFLNFVSSLICISGKSKEKGTPKNPLSRSSMVNTLVACSFHGILDIVPPMITPVTPSTVAIAARYFINFIVFSPLSLISSLNKFFFIISLNHSEPHSQNPASQLSLCSCVYRYTANFALPKSRL